MNRNMSKQARISWNESEKHVGICNDSEVAKKQVGRTQLTLVKLGFLRAVFSGEVNLTPHPFNFSKRTYLISI